MSYMHIENLYKSREILLFRECYALEKIHGTSAHIGWKDGKLSFFSGGVDYPGFCSLFCHDALKEQFTGMGKSPVIIYGEAYGGRCQGMKEIYGSKLLFVSFEVKVDESWLAVPVAEQVAHDLGLDFVDYRIIPATIEAIDAERDRESVQAIKNGVGEGKKREGIVLRPLIELRKNNGDRIIAKHKNEDFRETKTPRPLDEEKLRILGLAEATADEWVTEMRLTHVLDAFPGAGIERTGEIIRAMIEDIEREAGSEVENFKESRKAIGKRTAEMFKKRNVI